MWGYVIPHYSCPQPSPSLTPRYRNCKHFDVVGPVCKMLALFRARSTLNGFKASLHDIRPRRVPDLRRTLYLAPPYLLDDYIPRYHLLSSVDAAKKRSLAYAHLRECNLCPRLCGVNRYEKTGVCLIGAETVKVNTVAPHFGEGNANISPRSCI